MLCTVLRQSTWTQLGLHSAPFPDPDDHVSDLYGAGLKLPVSVFVGRDGRVSAYVPFPLDAETLRARLAVIL
jgi:hypothetical protein